MEIRDKVFCGDALSELAKIPDESVHCCITSPPYFGLRDYGVEGQLGLEQAPEEYVSRLIDIFREVKRVLRKDGTLWLNLGDSYAGGGRGCNTPKQKSNRGTVDMPMSTVPEGLKQKDLIGIPWSVAFALRTDGWYLRSDIIWAKNNPMPESVTDRPTRSHEYIFLLSKSKKYYYDADAIKEPVTDSSMARLGQDVDSREGSARANGGMKTNGKMKAVKFGGNKGSGDIGNRRYSGNEWAPKHKNLEYKGQTPHTMHKDRIRPNGINRSRELRYDSKENEMRTHIPSGKYAVESDMPSAHFMRNKRSVWTVNTKPYADAHFAVFPEELITPCILAGAPEGGIVLDPFAGSGTTLAAAKRNGRSYIGIELNPNYIKLIDDRLKRVFRQEDLFKDAAL